jgi:uncharacterized protein (DUF433 family)
MSLALETSATELGEMIVRSPDIIGGKPHIKGHRVGVHRVAAWWKLGLSIEEIGERLSTFAPAEIHSALAYYHLHREEVEGYLQAERDACDGLAHKSSAAALPNERLTACGRA